MCPQESQEVGVIFQSIHNICLQVEEITSSNFPQTQENSNHNEQLIDSTGFLQIQETQLSYGG